MFMIKYSRYLAFFFILVIIIPGVLAPISSDTSMMRGTSPTAADQPSIDAPVQTWQEFEGNLNQSIVMPGNDSLVPYRVDVNLTNLNRTDDRLLNGDFTSGVDYWQISNVSGKTFQVNESGPQGARSLQGNFTGLWNYTLNYPLNDTYQMDQFDEPNEWELFNGPDGNVTTRIDNNVASGTSGNFLNISCTNFDEVYPYVGIDTGIANRSFFFNGSAKVNQVIIKFRYQSYFWAPSTGTYAIIKSNITITNPSGISKTYINVINNATGDPEVGLKWHNASIGNGLETLFSTNGNYKLSLTTSIEQGNDFPPAKDLESSFSVDNVTIKVNCSIGTFDLGDATNVAQIIPLSQKPLNDTRVIVNYCASAIPARANHSNLQIGFAINETWFNLSALSDLTPNQWMMKMIWVGKGNFTGIAASVKLGLMSFNASQLFPNETLLLHFANVSLEIASNATAAELSLEFEEVTKYAPVTILGDGYGNVNASVDYTRYGGFGLGTSIRVHLNSTVPGGVRGRVMVYSWTWRDALWQSLNQSLTTMEAYIATLPNIYANLFSNTLVNFTLINFARSMAIPDFYLARTYASQVGPNAFYTASIANASLRLLWPALGNVSIGAGVPDTVREYVEEIYDAQKDSRSLVSFLQGDPRWGWVQGNTSLARSTIYTILENVPAKVPSYVNASVLVYWARTLQTALNSCIAGESWTIPEPSWTGGVTQLLTIGYSQMANQNLQRSLRPAFPILTTETQFVGGAPLLATLAQPTNTTTSWNYLTPQEFQFVAYFEAIIGFLAESMSLSRLLASLPTFLSTGTGTPASQYTHEEGSRIDIEFTSTGFGNPHLAITTAWQGNASVTSGWLVNSLYALSSTTPVLLWEQALPVENLQGAYSRDIQWLPPVLPPALNELYVDAWAQNWTAPIVLRSTLWVGGRAVSTNLGIQQESLEQWFNVSMFTTITGEDGTPLNISQINQTQQAGDWCLLSSLGGGACLEFRENGGPSIGYAQWGVFSNSMGGNASYTGAGDNLNLISLSGSWGGNLYLVPNPASNYQLLTGSVITKYNAISPYFAGISNGTLFLTPIIGEKLIALSLPAWEGTRTAGITNFAVSTQILSQSSDDISVTSVLAPSVISQGDYAIITLIFTCPTKPIGHQLELLLMLSGNADGIPIQRKVLITVQFVDVVSPQPPIPDSLFLASLTIVGSLAVALFIVRWYKFFYFRQISSKEPRSYRE